MTTACHCLLPIQINDDEEEVEDVEEEDESESGLFAISRVSSGAPMPCDVPAISEGWARCKAWAFLIIEGLSKPTNTMKTNPRLNAKAANGRSISSK